MVHFKVVKRSPRNIQEETLIETTDINDVIRLYITNKPGNRFILDAPDISIHYFKDGVKKGE